MAIVVDNPPMGVLTFWDSTTWSNVKVTIEEPMNNGWSSARATDHSTSEHLVFTALAAFLASGERTEVICSRAVRWGELRASVST